MGMVTSKNLSGVQKDAFSGKQGPFVKDVMERAFAKSSPGISTKKAIEKMASLESDYLLVIDDGQLIGILTENDLKEKGQSASL